MKLVNIFVTRGIKTIAKSKVFVPPSKPIEQNDLVKLQRFMDNAGKLLVMTGAGLSTESGIPDYRSEGVGLYARTGHRPVQYQDYVKIPKARQIYWARNFIGWPNFSSFEPNMSHITLADWETKIRIQWLVTQNVDALHKKAGSKKVTELHGCTHRIMCLSCDMQMLRWELQDIFKKLNPHFHAESLEIAPDGDMLLTEEQVEGFVVPSCHNCGGIIKPDVVFFGDNVKRDIVDFVFRQVDICDSMLIAGSSLEVYSGYRFVKRAKDQGKPIAMVNIGKTRGDHLVTLKVDAQCGHVLPNLKV